MMGRNRLRVDGSIAKREGPFFDMRRAGGGRDRNKCVACETQVREEGASVMSLSIWINTSPMLRERIVGLC